MITDSDFGQVLERELGTVKERLGADWQLSGGQESGYGNPMMYFLELRSENSNTTVRVWWRGAEVFLSAFLGVSHEASAELFTRSARRVADLVGALCRGRYRRHDGVVSVATNWFTRLDLTEWTDG
jgi:hypothetical protein